MTNRRGMLRGLGLVLGGAAISAGPFFLSACGSRSGGAASGTLRLITAQTLSSLDPIWTTAPGTRMFGFLVYDQLIALDANNDPQPQMAKGWSVEDDGRSYRITLRDGLQFHDGEPVRAQDCIPSIERWMARDSFGQLLAPFIAKQELIDDKSFRIRLTQPIPLLPAALGKTSAPSCLIMPERLATTDPGQQITEAVGSGPFRFLQDEWVSGASAAFVRFDQYVPRSEPVSGMAGGRIPAIERIEMTQIADSSTAMAALMAGEHDFWDLVPPDLYPILDADPNIVLDARLTSNGYYMLQFNHLQKPFDNQAVRRAVSMAVDQKEFLGSVGDPDNLLPCHSYFSCDEADVDPHPPAGAAGFEAAKQALAASGYAGEKVVLLSPMEGPLANLGQVAESMFRRLGMNIELVGLDFASMTQRRTNREPVDKGGWSAFLTAWLGDDIINPAVHPMLRGAGLQGYSGWATDPTLEELRVAWLTATDAKTRDSYAEAIERRAHETIPYVPLGASQAKAAYRDDLTGVFKAPMGVYWNIGKSD